MKHYVKETDGNGPQRLITMDNFLDDKMDAKPWEIEFGSGVYRHYATCHHCKNPIQLIGLFTPMSNGARPYGKHSDKRVKGFLNFDPEEYKLCPYFGKVKRWSKNDKRSRHNHVTLSVLKTVRDEFDAVIDIIQDFNGFKISPALARKMLEKYAAGVGPLYKGANGGNIPLAFALTSTRQMVFGQTIVDEKLKAALKKKVKGIYFDDNQRITKNPDGSFVGLEFHYVEHRVSEVDGEVHEQMKLIVFEVDRNKKPTQDVYRKVIKFRHEGQNLLFEPRDRTSERSKELLEIGHEVIDLNYPHLDKWLAAAKSSNV